MSGNIGYVHDGKYRKRRARLHNIHLEEISKGIKTAAEASPDRQRGAVPCDEGRLGRTAKSGHRARRHDGCPLCAIADRDHRPR